MSVFEDLEELRKHNFFFTQVSWSHPQIENTIKIHRQLDRIAFTLEALKIIVYYDVELDSITSVDEYEDYVGKVKEYYNKYLPSNMNEDKKKKLIDSYTMSEEEFTLVKEQCEEVFDYYSHRQKYGKNEKVWEQWRLERERDGKENER